MQRIASNDLMPGDLFHVSYPDGFGLAEVLCVEWLADSVSVAFYDLIHNKVDSILSPFNTVVEVWNG